jgi:hypothetical protein
VLPASIPIVERDCGGAFKIQDALKRGSDPWKDIGNGVLQRLSIAPGNLRKRLNATDKVKAYHLHAAVIFTISPAVIRSRPPIRAMTMKFTYSNGSTFRTGKF